jgi:hypothetical protein
MAWLALRVDNMTSGTMEYTQEVRLTDRRRDLLQDLQVLSLLFVLKKREDGVREEWPVPESAESVKEQKLLPLTL